MCRRQSNTAEYFWQTTREVKRDRTLEVNPMRMKLSILIAGSTLLLAAGQVAAHHAFAAEFDVNKPVKVNGTVTKIEFTNPHAWLYVDVKEPDGNVVNWRFELGAPNALIRLGWRVDTIKAGTEVEIEGFRAKAGGPVANGRSIKLPDGRELFSGGSAPTSDR
jgi:Family of unknown function (DUF6152)